jgi:hypothetical protein
MEETAAMELEETTTTTTTRLDRSSRREERRLKREREEEEEERRQQQQLAASKDSDETTAAKDGGEAAAVVDDDKAKLDAYMLQQFTEGLLPSLRKIKSWAEEQSVTLPPTRKLRQLRYNWKESAVLSGWKGTRHYAGAAIAKIGTIQLDLAYFGKKYLVRNRQKKYFLCAVDILTGKLAVVATTRKDRKAWEGAILEMIRNGSYEYIAHIMTDRDSIVSKDFRRRLKLEHGINWSFLPSRSSAFRSERMIAFCKRRFSLAASLSKDHVWIDKIDGILAEYNSQNIPGTDIPRDSVTKENFMSLLEKLRNSKDPTMFHHLSTSHNFSPNLQAKLWKYKLGQRVLVAREADYEAEGQKSNSFFKRSVDGSWAPTVRTVTDLWMKDSRYRLTPTYAVSGLVGKFYESELLGISFAE